MLPRRRRVGCARRRSRAGRAVGVEIGWTGSFSAVFYGGMTYRSVSDPQLTVDASGNGRLTATASGYGTDMDDPSKWTVLPEQTIVLAEVRGADVASGSGFAVVPEFLSFAAAGRLSVPRNHRVQNGHGVRE